MILFLGDSITEGFVKQGLEHWNRHLAPLGAENRGFWGDDCGRLLKRIESGLLDGLAPRLTVLKIGTNDIPWDPPREGATEIPARVIARVTAVVDAVRAKLPGTQILLLAIFPRGEDHDVSRDLIPEVNRGLARIPGVRFADLGHLFWVDGVLPLTMLYDTLHLTPAAYERWAEALVPLIS